MNDRIERLCEELLHYDDMIFGWRETVQRVAEAIVKESAEVGSYYGGNVKHLILEHFGVEP